MENLTPPLELVQQWEEDWYHSKDVHVELLPYIAAQSAQYGADQELEECCEWVETECPGYGRPYEKLRAARRPSLNSIALEMLGTIERDGHYIPEITGTIRRALEQLDD
jgi:hypothetical protein